MKIKLYSYESCKKIGKELSKRFIIFELSDTYGLFEGLFEECSEVQSTLVRSNGPNCYETKEGFYIPVIFVSHIIND